MITIFNRQELSSTFDIKEMAEICNSLSNKSIDYYVKTINRKSPSPISAGSRAYTGTLGENLNMEYEYIIYVKKVDYENACYLIRLSKF